MRGDGLHMKRGDMPIKKGEVVFYAYQIRGGGLIKVGGACLCQSKGVWFVSVPIKRGDLCSGKEVWYAIQRGGGGCIKGYEMT